MRVSFTLLRPSRSWGLSFTCVDNEPNKPLGSGRSAQVFTVCRWGSQCDRLLSSPTLKQLFWQFIVTDRVSTKPKYYFKCSTVEWSLIVTTQFCDGSLTHVLALWILEWFLRKALSKTSIIAYLWHFHRRDGNSVPIYSRLFSPIHTSPEYSATRTIIQILSIVLVRKW